MSENLKPCPFCESAVVPTESQDGWSVKCGECGNKTEKFKTRYQLHKYYNDRPETSNTEQFKEMLEMMRSVDKKMDILFEMARGQLKEKPPQIEA